MYIIYQTMEMRNIEGFGALAIVCKHDMFDMITIFT